MYKPINFRSGLFSELRYMSNGLTSQFYEKSFSMK